MVLKISKSSHIPDINLGSKLMLKVPEMVQSIECLLLKHEEQHSDLKNTQGKVGVTALGRRTDTG